MLKLVFDRFYIEMNEQDIARIIFDFLRSVSNGNIVQVIGEWKFEIVQSLTNNHEIGFSYKLKELDVKNIEASLKQIHGLSINFNDTRPDYATERYLVVYLPT